jgi:HTH-type transcriptional regulator/antitoxin HipB
MSYPVATPSQLRAVLRSLRKARGMTQAELGRRVGRSQKRIARIESSPERASFEQVSQLIAILGGRLVVEDTEDREGKRTPAAEW